MDTRPQKPIRKKPVDRKSGDPSFEKMLSDNHGYFAKKLEIARQQIASGEIAPLEDLQDLLRQARKQRRRKKL